MYLSHGPNVEILEFDKSDWGIYGDHDSYLNNYYYDARLQYRLPNIFIELQVGIGTSSLVDLNESYSYKNTSAFDAFKISNPRLQTIAGLSVGLQF